jgi:pSer/pThr/pTyr-binding forkhead associated (FHA) protein
VPPGTVAVIEVDGRVQPVSKAVTVLGRGVDADVVLDDPGVSRRHAEIHVLDGKLRLVDLGSTNGTYLDGERVHAGPIADGSTITMGRSRLVVHLGGW